MGMPYSEGANSTSQMGLSEHPGGRGQHMVDLKRSPTRPQI